MGRVPHKLKSDWQTYDFW